MSIKIIISFGDKEIRMAGFFSKKSMNVEIADGDISYNIVFGVEWLIFCKKFRSNVNGILDKSSDLVNICVKILI